jgi:hypothetical protein
MVSVSMKGGQIGLDDILTELALRRATGMSLSLLYIRFGHVQRSSDSMEAFGTTGGR